MPAVCTADEACCQPHCTHTCEKHCPHVCVGAEAGGTSALASCIWIAVGLQDEVGGGHARTAGQGLALGLAGSTFLFDEFAHRVGKVISKASVALSWNGLWKDCRRIVEGL